MAVPVQGIRIWDIQDRTKRTNATRPWVLRWKVGGAERNRAFKTKAERGPRARLVIAARDGKKFDRARTPLSWQPRPTGACTNGFVTGSRRSGRSGSHGPDVPRWRR